MVRGSKRLASPLHLLHRAGQRADYLFARHVGSHAFTPRQFAVLQAVADADGLSQTAIMTATGIDRSGTAELVRRLVSSGLLQRRRTKAGCARLCRAAYAAGPKNAGGRRACRACSKCCTAVLHPRAATCDLSRRPCCDHRRCLTGRRSGNGQTARPSCLPIDHRALRAGRAQARSWRAAAPEKKSMYGRAAGDCGTCGRIARLIGRHVGPA